MTKKETNQLTTEKLLRKNLKACVKVLKTLIAEDDKVVSTKSIHSVFTIKEAGEAVTEATQILKIK